MEVFRSDSHPMATVGVYIWRNSACAINCEINSNLDKFIFIASTSNERNELLEYYLCGDPLNEYSTLPANTFPLFYAKNVDIFLQYKSSANMNRVENCIALA